jgi:WD40 repeat protein
MHLARANSYDPASTLASELAVVMLNDCPEVMPSAMLIGHTDTIRDVQLSPDGRQIVTASEDKTARVWDIGSGKLLTTLRHDEPVNAAQFRPDGRQIVTASHDQTVRVWELLGTASPPPGWFSEFLCLIAQRKFNNYGEIRRGKS